MQAENQPENQPLSEVAPLLVAALVCEAAIADPNTGMQNLIGIFDRVKAAKFPITRTWFLYFKIADAQGRYKFDLRYVQVSTDAVLAQAEGTVTVNDRLDSPDFCLQWPPLLIPEPDKYEFQIWANSMFLGSTFFVAHEAGVP